MTSIQQLQHKAAALWDVFQILDSCLAEIEDFEKDVAEKRK